MKNPTFGRAAAAVLSAAFLACGAVHAQTAVDSNVTPRMDLTPRVDTAPSPAEDRNSLGAVVMMEEPVLAQREQMQNLARSAPDTRAMGAGAERVMQRASTREDLFQQRLIEALEFYRRGPAAATPK